ncbi:hypothetical protein [Rhodovibrio sodomensis]|nr:hypothetical protein [Rhodovibrio sodomensis]
MTAAPLPPLGGGGQAEVVAAIIAGVNTAKTALRRGTAVQSYLTLVLSFD